MPNLSVVLDIGQFSSKIGFAGEDSPSHVFFTIVGMLIDIKIFTNQYVILFGLIYTAFAILSKLLFCGIPPLFFKFNIHGALRIGLGMVPRGEVVFILASTWLSHGLINQEIFGIAMFMAIVTTLLSPPLFSKLLKSKVKTNNIELADEKEEIIYNYPSEEITNIFADDYWIQKQRRAEKMGIGFIGLDDESLTSSTEIINNILKEF